MGTKTITDRTEFTRMGKSARREYDLRSAFDPSFGEQGALMASCIRPENHNNGDASASMAIYHDGVFCRGCGEYWWPDAFLLELGDRDLTTEAIRTYGKIAAAPTPTKVVANTFCFWLAEGPYQDRLGIMYRRGLRRDTLFANRIGHNGEGFTIPVYDRGLTQPIFDEDGALLTIRYRRDDERSPERPKYWGTPGHNEPLLYIPANTAPRRSTRTILVEGELDALRLSQEGYRAVSITNGSGAMSKSLPRLLPQLEAYTSTGQFLLCTDQDTPGRRAAEAMRRALEGAGHRAQPIFWPENLGKDATDFLNRWPVREFAKYAEEAERCAFGE